jgi:hypothetical protein
MNLQWHSKLPFVICCCLALGVLEPRYCFCKPDFAEHTHTHTHTHTRVYQLDMHLCIAIAPCQKYTFCVWTCVTRVLNLVYSMKCSCLKTATSMETESFEIYRKY